MFRRRPLMRAAVVGGVAYHAGKRGAQNAQQEADQNAQIEELQQQQQYQQAPPAAAPAPGGMDDDAMARLQKLAELHTQGVLTDAEFEVQKQKILQGM
jgi:Short C-terminal domain